MAGIFWRFFNRREIRKNIQAARRFGKEERREYAAFLVQYGAVMDDLDAPGSPPNVTKESALTNGLIIIQERRLGAERKGANSRKHHMWNLWATIETRMLLTLLKERGQLSADALREFTAPIRLFISANLTPDEVAAARRPLNEYPAPPD